MYQWPGQAHRSWPLRYAEAAFPAAPPQRLRPLHWRRDGRHPSPCGLSRPCGERSCHSPAPAGGGRYSRVSDRAEPARVAAVCRRFGEEHVMQFRRRLCRHHDFFRHGGPPADGLPPSYIGTAPHVRAGSRPFAGATACMSKSRPPPLRVRCYHIVCGSGPVSRHRTWPSIPTSWKDRTGGGRGSGERAAVENAGWTGSGAAQGIDTQGRLLPGAADGQFAIVVMVVGRLTKLERHGSLLWPAFNETSILGQYLAYRVKGESSMYNLFLYAMVFIRLGR